jgi:hypothetical protein
MKLLQKKAVKSHLKNSCDFLSKDTTKILIIQKNFLSQKKIVLGRRNYLLNETQQEQEQ